MNIKHLLIGLALSIGVGAQAQIGATAPDFTVTDLDGGTHNLYEYLDAGKIVILDVSATWCGPCWTLHEAHVLQEIHELYGPDGTDEIRVIYYEGDAQTDLADLQGTGGATQGNWLEGSTYPFINEAPLTLDLNVYAPLGFPTVNVIRPSDYQIVADPWNVYTLEEQISIIESSTGITLSEVSAIDENEASLEVNLFPNPATDVLNIDLSTVEASVDNLIITDAVGREVKRVAVLESGLMTIAIDELAEGSYMINLISEEQTIGVRSFLK